MKQLFAIAILTLAASLAFAQDKPATKAADKPVETKPAAAKPAPAELKFTEDQAREVELLGTRLQLAEERTKNAKLQMEYAQEALKQQQSVEAQTRINFQQFLSDTALRLGVAKEDLPNWRVDYSGGLPVLKRKDEEKPAEKGAK